MGVFGEVRRQEMIWRDSKLELYNYFAIFVVFARIAIGFPTNSKKFSGNSFSERFVKFARQNTFAKYAKHANLACLTLFDALAIVAIYATIVDNVSQSVA